MEPDGLRRGRVPFPFGERVPEVRLWEGTYLARRAGQADKMWIGYLRYGTQRY